MSGGFQLGQNVVADLALMELNAFYLEAADAEETREWFERHVSLDPDVIAQRSRGIQALLKYPHAQEALRAQIEAMRRVERIDRRPVEKQGRLVRCSLYIKALGSFVDAAQSLGDITNLDSGLDALLLPMRALLDSPAFLDAKSRLERARDIFTPLEDIAAGVNITEDGDAVQLFLMDVNSHEAMPRGIFEPYTDGESNALFKAIPVRVRRELVHMEAYIQARVEKLWHGMLRDALNILTPFPTEALTTWVEWAREMEPVLAGVSLAMALVERGCALCAPECSDKGLFADGLHPVHITLRAEALPVPYDVEMAGASLCLVTGANHSGKTTFLRAIAQAHLFAQTGFLIPAQAFRFSPVKSMHTLFSAGETRDVSRFEREALDMHAIMEAAGEGAAVFLNEPFTSTNPREAEPLLLDIAERLHGMGGRQFIVTHLYGLYGPLKRRLGNGIKSYVTQSHVDEMGIRYAYRVQEGPPDAISYARQIAAVFGLSARALVEDTGRARQVEAFLRSVPMDGVEEDSACFEA